MGNKSSSPRSQSHPYAAPQSHQYNAPPPPPPQSHAPPQKKLDRRYSKIADNYNSLEEVTEALARAGLESSNLIVGIDFTKSNE
ncbi:E3 ubiquitin-protein ligase rglg2 [Phtheirospermum japonicum]|uniref:E3 ubiquitin-protein ligase rglg2 n=1 Tax=Phtheirospermum japonicum TaxID=374723 RepID=A0A830BSI6_9LAMI|nr:E3 ubiquitin-protein ligase rglg2 [Phtheirospermum japonicum]